MIQTICCVLLLHHFQPIWTSIPGQGAVRRWSVNDICTRVRIELKKGITKTYRLAQYEFQNGDHIQNSMLVLNDKELIVTHNHGAFIVNTSGKVEHELADSLPKGYKISSGRRVVDLVVDPSPWLYARAFNGKTIAMQSDEKDYVELVSPTLKRLFALTFAGKVESIRPRKNGWSFLVQHGRIHERFDISNKGTLEAVLKEKANPSHRPRSIVRK